jgi:dUTP pyrophosphatase
MGNDDLKDLEGIFAGIEEDADNYDAKNIALELGLDLDHLEEQLQKHNPKMDVRYSSYNDNIVEPKYAYSTDSGFDLHSSIGVEIPPFGRALVPTGLHFDIPDGYEIQVRSKSGLALKQGLMVLNSPGTVDQGYTGEVMAIIFNTTNDVAIINKGQKVAQAVLCPVVAGKWVNLVKVNNIEDKDRSDKGFGSTGI